MNGAIEWLRGKKTYVMIALAFIYGGGVQIGLWERNSAIDLMLAGGTVVALRAGVTKSGPALPMILALLIVPIVGCATLQRIAQVNLPFVETEAQLACGAALKLAVSDADRADVANMIYSVAEVADSLAGGTAPTPEDFATKLKAWGVGNGDKYASLVSLVADVWAKFYPNVKDDPALALATLGKISAGCCDAARPYLPPTPQTSSAFNLPPGVELMNPVYTGPPPILAPLPLADPSKVIIAPAAAPPQS